MLSVAKHLLYVAETKQILHYAQDDVMQGVLQPPFGGRNEITVTAESQKATNHSGWGVLLLAHGAPDRLADIPKFLMNVRGGRPLPAAAVEEIINRYAVIGGGSPLLEITTRQAGALAKATGLPVHVGMRNWSPYIEEAVLRMNKIQVARAVALCLAPQNSRTSIGLYKSCLSKAVEKAALQLQVEFVESWHEHPGLIAAFSEKAAAALARIQAESGRPVPVVFTAHSVPVRTIEEGDPYEQQVKETAGLVARAMGLSDYEIAFQSQGMTPEPWVGPTVESRIDALAAQGCGHVLLVPIGFVADHVEILYDIDVVFRDYGRKKGVAVSRSESLNDSPLFIQALASIVSNRIGVSPPVGSSL
jgi:protoporphyrin/coproporphyrin ferrochelatase